jgi:hypothetical protein
MTPVPTIKRLAAIVLVVSFFLPLARCSLPTTDARTEKLAPDIAVDISAYSAYEWPSAGSTIYSVLFGWAALIQILALRNPGLETRREVLALEITLSVLTIAGISWAIYTWGQSIRYGALMAYAAVIVYAAAAIGGRKGGRYPNHTVEGM